MEMFIKVKKANLKRKFLLSIIIVLIVGCLIVILKIDDTRPLSFNFFGFDSGWNNIKISGKEELEEKYSYLYNALSDSPLPDDVQVKEFEYASTFLAHNDERYIRIWLELPADKNLVNETMGLLSVPITNNKFFYVKTQLQKDFSVSDSTVIIEVLREVIDKDKYLYGAGIDAHYHILNNREAQNNNSIEKIFIEQFNKRIKLIIILLIQILGLAVAIGFYFTELLIYKKEK